MDSTHHPKCISSPHSPGRPRLVGRLSLVRLSLPLLCLAAGHAFGADTVVEAVAKPAPLVEAAHAGDDAKATALLTAQPHPDVNQKTSDGTSALHWAVYHNDASLIEPVVLGG